jgi:hypothetical protein
MISKKCKVEFLIGFFLEPGLFLFRFSQRSQRDYGTRNPLLSESLHFFRRWREPGE